MFMYIRGRLYYVFNREIDFVFAIPSIDFRRQNVLANKPICEACGFWKEFHNVDKSRRRQTTSSG